jgi:uncharacterized protein YjbI with pentapeptide repeats
MKKIVLICLISVLLAACGAKKANVTTTLSDRKPDAGHLAKLMEGVDAWNQWRKDNPKIVTPDLEDADLTGANLENYDLKHAALSNAVLVNANLRGADLTNANLRVADLTGADLTGAILTGARYDNRTTWPEGFDPVAAGAILK